MLKGKRILIIGGTSGFGLSAALYLMDQGARIAVTGKEDPYLGDAKALFNDTVFISSEDITTEEGMHKIFTMSTEFLGGLDGLLHVAGGSGRKMGDGPLHEMKAEGWQYTMDLNLTSVMLSNKYALDYFIEKNISGSIVNISSVLAFAPAPQFFVTHAYAAAKSGIIGLSKSLAAYYASYGIRINVVAPGLSDTPMAKRALADESIMQYVRQKQRLDGGRALQPQDLDGTIGYLLSDQSAFITGQVIAVDGGWSVIG